MGLFPNLPDALISFLLFLTLAFASISRATRIEILNNCTYVVWAAANPGGGKQLKQGQTWTLDVNGSGRIWGRTNCAFSSDGRGKCESGDCDGRFDCQANGRAPNTVAQYSLDQSNNNDIFYVSVVEGFNIPMEFSPAGSSSNCGQVSKCAADVNGPCPMELGDPGGCNNPCTVFGNDQFCCTSGNICQPTSYSQYFSNLCRNAFTYPSDIGQRSSCPTGTDYKVVFCPSSVENINKTETGFKGKAVSLYLMPSDWEDIETKAAVYAKYKLRLLDQLNGKHHEGSVCACFGPSEGQHGLGYPEFISLEDLLKPSNGFIVNDSVIVEVGFAVVSETQVFP